MNGYKVDKGLLTEVIDPTNSQALGSTYQDGRKIAFTEYIQFSAEDLIDIAYAMKAYQRKRDMGLES